MPNHIKNRIEIIGEPIEVKQVFEKYNTFYKAELNRSVDGLIICNKKDKSEYGYFDEKTGIFKILNKPDVLGIPKEYEMEIKPAYKHFPDFNKIIPQPENIFLGNLGEKEEKECKEKGIPNWYDWNIANWGTKWNSYSCEKINENTFVFETAWSGVPEIIFAMSKQNPTLTFLYAFADEDIGCNVGKYIFKNGLQEETYFENGSKEAYELAFMLHPEDRNNYVLINGEYEYKEEE